MKLRQEDNLVISNTNNEKRFTIAASAKAFKILSDSLYSRKIEAIVRELSCNAYDSHVQAGYPERPFIITAPNMWQPEFSVEDFGVGLDDEDIENIYTSYFTSTKTESNDVIGALGLGSKTPFSYTDAFNIRSRKNGVEYTYSAYINGMGEPSVSMLSRVDTSEPNGVKITVPVRQNDFHQFKEDIRKVATWFKDAPEINGADDITIDNRNAVRLHEEEFFWVRRGNGTYHADRVVAVMGNVAYQVDSVSSTFGDHLTDGEKAWLNENLVYIKFNIGDLDVAASRETISFDEHTIAVFVEKLLSCIHGYSKEIQVNLDTIPCVVDAIDKIEREVGFWANSLFTYSDAYIAYWVEVDLMTELRRVFLHNTENRSERKVFDGEYTYSGNGYYSSTVRKRNMRYDSLKLSQCTNRHFVIIDNCSGISTTRMARSKAAEKSMNYVFLVYDKLSKTQIEGIQAILGKRVEFVDAKEERDRLSEIAAIERAEKKKEREMNATLTGVPVARAEKIKKTLIRAWVLEIDVDKENDAPYVELSKDSEFDVSKLDNINPDTVFRVPLLRYKADIGPHEINMVPEAGEFNKIAILARLYKVKYLIIYLPGDRVRNERILSEYSDWATEIKHMKYDQMFAMNHFMSQVIKGTVSNYGLGVVGREVAGSLITDDLKAIINWYAQFSRNDIIYDVLVSLLPYTEQRKISEVVNYCNARIEARMEKIAEQVFIEYPLLRKIETGYQFSSTDARDYVSIVRLAKEYLATKTPLAVEEENDVELNEVA